MGRVETVSGSIEPEELGITLPHEHIICDLTTAWASKISLLPKQIDLVTLKDLSEIRENPLIMKDNLKLQDAKLATKEIKAFKNIGGSSIVDLTTSFGRDPITLREISKETQIHIIAATGWYTASSHPPYVKKKNVKELREMIVHDLLSGFNDTGIKAGAIGEIGCSASLHHDERKVLEAAAQAQRDTHACLYVHITSWNLNTKTQPRNGLTHLDIIEKEGGNPEKCVMCHMDSYNKEGLPLLGVDIDYHRTLLNRNATIEYDLFGRFDSSQDNVFAGATFPSDRERIAAIVELCKQGYDKQLLLSQDVCQRIHYTTYGGKGYAFILKHIVPRLKYAGVSDKQIRNMLIENHKELLNEVSK